MCISWAVYQSDRHFSIITLLKLGWEAGTVQNWKEMVWFCRSLVLPPLRLPKPVASKIDLGCVHVIATHRPFHGVSSLHLAPSIYIDMSLDTQLLTHLSSAFSTLIRDQLLIIRLNLHQARFPKKAYLLTCSILEPSFELAAAASPCLTGRLT